MPSPTPSSPPRSILIIGTGVFGLSTAHSLSLHPQYTNTTITLLDRHPFPPPDSSSIDTSRIIRADYSSPTYASLAAAAQSYWRNSHPEELGGEGRYSESGLVLVADKGSAGEGYVQGSWENVSRMAKDAGDEQGVEFLAGKGEIEQAVGTGGGNGDWGYLNRRSGWADAEGGMRWLRKKVEETGRVRFLQKEVQELAKEGERVVGVRTTAGELLNADLVILTTGAWTGKLVNLNGIATATGQVLTYLDITVEEQERLGKMPVLLNMSTGLFIIPPANQLLKVARHAYGYSNPVEMLDPDGSGQTISVSLPRTAVDDPGQWVPVEGEAACRQALREMIPSLADRPFVKSRICWYTDTPKGDFLITYHPTFSGLFLATGGSGHGYKFLPVIGDRIVDVINGRCPEEFKEKWGWPQERVERVVTEDGSRGGRPGLILDEEMRKGSRL